MDKCRKTQDMLADYRTGVLSARLSREVEEHLARCIECAAELKTLDDVLALLELNAVECEPPAGLWNGVRNRITSPEPRRAAFGVGARKWLGVPARAAGVGVAALALALGLMLGGVHDTRTGPATMGGNSEYIQGHALYASQAPLADQVAYLSLADVSNPRQDKSK